MNIIDIVNDLITKIPYVEMIPAANVLVPAVVAIVSIIFAHYGKRLLNVLKFVVCAGAGCAPQPQSSKTSSKQSMRFI